VDSSGNDGNVSMPEQVKRPNPWMMMMRMMMINAQENYYISNKGLQKECDKDEEVEVTAGDATSSL